MATKTLRQTKSALLAKGFRQSHTHHEYYHYYDGEKETEVYTYLSHREGGSDLRPNEISGMKSQMCLKSQSEVISFISCSLTAALYRQRLQSLGKIVPYPGER